MAEENAGELAWVQTLLPWMSRALAAQNLDGQTVNVYAGYELAYTHEILRYDWHDKPVGCRNAYQTDLLISDCCANKEWWIPRVVIEFKLGGITTHVTQTYSTKAATHKQVHPYLRYGLVMAEVGDCIPPRVIRHGTHFDFIAAVRHRKLTRGEREMLVSIVSDELRSARELHGLFLDRSHSRDRCRYLHRRLTID
jgi:hypothetical protein